MKRGPDALPAVIPLIGGGRGTRMRGELGFEAHVAPPFYALPADPFDWRIPVRIFAKRGFTALFGVRFEFICIKNEFVLSTPKKLSPLFAIDD